MADRVCRGCNTPTASDDQRFCEECGASLIEAEPAKTTKPPQEPTEPAGATQSENQPAPDKESSEATVDEPVSIRRPFEPLTETDPTDIGRYQLLVRLGAGGFGTVYLGQDKNGGLAAIKVIHPGLASDPTFRSRFRREVELGMRVRSKFTTQLLAADVDAPQPWMATEFVDGPSLSEAVTNQPLDQNAVLAIAAGTIQALIDIHAAGVIHRDLKPSNILLTEAGPRIVDFGIARAGDQTAVTATGAVLGSPAFLSPEQVEGEEVTPVSDVFSWAASICFAASGQSPFGEGAPAALLYRIIQQDPDIPDLDQPLADVITGALTKDPKLRPQAKDIASSLGIPQGVVGASEAAAKVVEQNWRLPADFFDDPRPVPKPRPRATTTGGSSRPVTAGITAAFIAAAVTAFLLFGGGSDDGESTDTAQPAGTPPPTTAVSPPTTTTSTTTTSTTAQPPPEGLVASIADAQNAVIRIEVSGSFQFPSDDKPMDGGFTGSGFIIDPSGLAITNNHVVAGASAIQVFVGEEGVSHRAQIVARSECSDVALIDIAGSGYNYLAWHLGEVKTGEPIYAAGFPLGDPEFTLTRGIISKDQASTGLDTSWASLEHQIEHDATINPGSSGGPLLTDDAQVIGVNYADSDETTQSLAISVKEVLPIFDQFRSGRDVSSFRVNGEAIYDYWEDRYGI